jgi:hypothetical protein
MSAGITSSVSGNTTTYVITDSGGNTLTVVAPAAPGGLTYTSSGALLISGQQLLTVLNLMLQTGLRPNVIGNTVASFSN